MVLIYDVRVVVIIFVYSLDTTTDVATKYRVLRQKGRWSFERIFTFWKLFWLLVVRKWTTNWCTSHPKDSSRALALCNCWIANTLRIQTIFIAMLCQKFLLIMWCFHKGSESTILTLGHCQILLHIYWLSLILILIRTATSLSLVFTSKLVNSLLKVLFHLWWSFFILHHLCLKIMRFLFHFVLQLIFYTFFVLLSWIFISSMVTKNSFWCCWKHVW